VERSKLETLCYSGTGDPHAHHHTQIVIPFSGSLELEVNGRQSIIEKGSAALISQTQKHHHYAQKQNECIVVNNIPSWDSEAEVQSSFINLTSETLQLLPFLKHLSSHSSVEEHKLETSLALLGLLLPLPKTKLTRSAQLFKKAESILSNTPNIKIKALAEQLHISHSALHSLFIKHANTTPKQFQQSRLADKIEQLLISDPHQTLDELAFTLNLPDPTSLARIYKRVRNTSPKSQSTFK
jgi:AraC-type DNA-binding domain-containing proteins